MTTTLVAPYTSLTARDTAQPQTHLHTAAQPATAHATAQAGSGIHATPHTAAATLTVAGMEGRWRRGVEKLLCELPEAPTTSEDDAIWFTRWRRAADGTYECRETLRAPAEALASFADHLDAYAKSHRFVASVTPRPYDGAHV